MKRYVKQAVATCHGRTFKQTLPCSTGKQYKEGYLFHFVDKLNYQNSSSGKY